MGPEKGLALGRLGVIFFESNGETMFKSKKTKKLGFRTKCKKVEVKSDLFLIAIFPIHHVVFSIENLRGYSKNYFLFKQYNIAQIVNFFRIFNYLCLHISRFSKNFFFVTEYCFYFSN